MKNNKYTPGDYEILFFDERHKEACLSKTSGSLLLAQSVKEKYIIKHPKHTVVIMRVIQNSFYSTHSNWE